MRLKFRRMLDKDFKHILMFEAVQERQGKDVAVAALEVERIKDNMISLENIWRVPKYRGIRILPKAINWIEHHFKPKAIVCLPLKKYIPYYESLGFKVLEVQGDDIYYIKEIR